MQRPIIVVWQCRAKKCRRVGTASHMLPKIILVTRPDCSRVYPAMADSVVFECGRPAGSEERIVADVDSRRLCDETAITRNSSEQPLLR